MTSLTNIANKIINRKGNETIDGHSKHWWQHEVNNARADGYKRGYAAGKKVMRDSAVKVCEKYGAKCCDEIIAALPVPEVRWLDLTDDELGWLICREFHGELGRFARAVIAKFKEKQLPTNSCQNSAELVEIPPKLHRAGIFGD